MCADICMCADQRCPSRTLCYRFTAKADPMRQAYFSGGLRGKDSMRCSEFWDNSANGGNPDPTDMLGF